MVNLMKHFLKWLADNTKPNSLASRLRRKRFRVFLEMLNCVSTNLNRPLKILDVGGTEIFWEMMEATSLPHHITLLNLSATTTRNPNIASVAGDARQMDIFSDKQFDIVLSNSVIEHLGTFSDQAKMAKEVRRVASYYFIQTPCFFFPLEPHFLFPFFHWLPRNIRIWLLMRFSLGWLKKQDDEAEASRIVDEIRLMKYSELKKLFPDAHIIRERFLGLTKSYIAVKSCVPLHITSKTPTLPHS